MADMEKLGLFNLEKKGLTGKLLALYLISDHREERAKLCLERYR